jgi:hypothetical protein
MYRSQCIDVSMYRVHPKEIHDISLTRGAFGGLYRRLGIFLHLDTMLSDLVGVETA